MALLSRHICRCLLRFRGSRVGERWPSMSVARLMFRGYVFCAGVLLVAGSGYSGTHGTGAANVGGSSSNGGANSGGTSGTGVFYC